MCLSTALYSVWGDTFVFIFSTDHKQTTSFPLPGLSLSLSLKTQNSILNSQKSCTRSGSARTSLLKGVSAPAGASRRRRPRLGREDGRREVSTTHPRAPAAPAAMVREPRAAATSPLDEEVMPSRWRRISATKRRFGDFGNLGGNVVWPLRPAGLPAREKKRVSRGSTRATRCEGTLGERGWSPRGGERSRPRGGQGRFAGGFGLPSSPPRRNPEPTAQA